MVLPPRNLSDYTSVAVEYGEYDESLDLERGETTSGAVMHTSIDAENEN